MEYIVVETRNAEDFEKNIFELQALLKTYSRDIDKPDFNNVIPVKEGFNVLKTLPAQTQKKLFKVIEDVSTEIFNVREKKTEITKRTKENIVHTARKKNTAVKLDPKEFVTALKKITM